MGKIDQKIDVKPVSNDNNDHEFSEMKKKKDRHQKRMIFTLLLIFFTEVLGFTIMIPVLPYLATDLGMNQFEIGALASIFSFCQFFAAPITGKLSDRYGRKPMLLISQSSTFLGFFILGFADAAWILVVARVVDGLLGSNMTVVQATISDITKPEERTRIYSLTSGVFGAGLIFGPAVGGILGDINYSLPMFTAAGVSLISILLVVITLPETYKHRAKELSLSVNDIFPIQEIKRYTKTPRIKFQLLMLLAYNFAFMFFINNFTLILMEKYEVSASEAGYARTWIGLIRVGLQFFAVERLLKMMGENKTLNTGIWAMAISMVAMIFTSIYWILFIPLIFLSYGTGVARPILTSQLTNSVGKKEYATVLGINNSLNSLLQIFSPLLGGMILYLGSPWIIMVISALGFIIVILIMKKREKECGECPTDD